MRARAAMGALLAVLGTVGPSLAHEFWVQPETFAPAVGERTPVRLFVGDVGNGGGRDELARRTDHLLRFEAVGPRGAVPIVGWVGRVPAGLLRPAGPGPLVLVYRSRHTFLELPAEKFESYLENEGLSRIVSERVRRNETLEPGRESYARYAKSLVVVAGDGGAAAMPTFGREVGLPIEFVPETDPGTWQSGDPFAVRLLYDGEPLADQQLRLIDLDGGGLSLTYRTDADGRAELRPPREGRWLVASVHMRRAPEGVEGDWESSWASLSLELPGEGESKPPPPE